MWKWLFRTPEDEPEFPQPQWAPIQNVDSVDIIGTRADGGVDLIIFASQPLDDNPQTLRLLRGKVQSYLEWIEDPEFLGGVNQTSPDQTTIVIACDDPIHEAAKTLIEECQRHTAEQGIRLEVRKSAVSLADEIVAARGGVTHCGIFSLKSPTLSELAKEFNLGDDPCSYREIDVNEARRVVQYVLQCDLAYNAHRMKPTRAENLADLFLSQFGNVGVAYFTNGTMHDQMGSPQRRPTTWIPATAATFDTGVLVIGPTRSGCLWVEDED